MPKALTIIGMTVAVLLVLMFGLDLGMGFPFSKANSTMDIIFLICAGVLGFLSWQTFRQLT